MFIRRIYGIVQGKSAVKTEMADCHLRALNTIPIPMQR